MNKILSTWLIFFFIIILLSAIKAEAQETNKQEAKIELIKSKGSIYKLLNQVSEKYGFLFIYDSQLIDNSKVVRIPGGEFPLLKAIHLITENNNLAVRSVGNHVLLFLPDKNIDTLSLEKSNVQESFFTISGSLLDHLSNEPIVFGSVSVNNSSYGTISNQEGEFQLTLPNTLKDSIIKISHLGYQTREINASLLSGQHIVYYLDQKIIPLQEIVVRVIDPIRALSEVMQRIRQNYSPDPVYLTTFYREGVENKKNLSLIEAVVQIYKTGVQSNVNSEQIKLLKMRRIANMEEKDTIVTKVKSSLNACLLLDIIKNPPDFLLKESYSQYNYSLTDITTIDERRVFVFSFEQKEYISDPLYCGELYVDAENYALLKARFEINPNYVRESADMLIAKKRHGLSVTPIKVVYEASYKPLNGYYYINHIRGDLFFKIRKKKRLFSSDLHVWFEMVNCKIETEDVKKFSNEERISTRDIFSETSFPYDRNFWGNMNIILPEEKLKELIRQYNFDQENK